MTEKQILKNIESQVKAFFALEKKRPKTKKFRLMDPFYDHKEVMQVVDSLLRREITLNHAAGTKVQRFEDLWARYVGKKEGIMVNSGSSANLMALELLRNPLMENPLKPGDEIITPALTWNTTVTPMWALGFVPVFVDVDQETFTMKVEEIEKAMSPKTRAIMPVHLLGHPCDMSTIMKIAKKHNLFVIEDCCEAHGAEIDGKIVGSFGDLATFSFFFSHHLTTMEGGMVLTNDIEHSEIIRTMRSEGVMRNWKSKRFADSYHNNPKYKDIQQAFLWTNMGYNVRPTQLNGGFALEQFKKFPTILKVRRENGDFFLKALKKYGQYIHVSTPAKNVKHAWFGIPILVKENSRFTRKDLESFLNSKGIETRQIMAGDITKQPAFELFPSRVVGGLKNTKAIHKNAFLFGNHPLIKSEEKKYILACMDEFFAKLK
jgi:CDP-6-deoxy-D-xylo-4-hexulose-3-dehydrase